MMIALGATIGWDESRNTVPRRNPITRLPGGDRHFAEQLLPQVMIEIADRHPQSRRGLSDRDRTNHCRDHG